ncbi:SBBP repeat-containing protein, partial [Klebsiella pneumoniae]|uniref:SBBP repeat-containing protein n=1 Tax=Klebsiella pneumoniae TaxID=573 RepID=UPI003854DCBE
MAFLAQFNTAGILQWGTYYGGGGQDLIKKMIVDIYGNIFVAGTTNSITGIATPGAYRSS